MKTQYSRGPFDLEVGPLEDTEHNMRRCVLTYGNKTVLDRKIRFPNREINPYTLHDYVKFAVDGFIANAKLEHGPNRVDLIHGKSGGILSSFYTYDSFEECGLTPGLHDPNALYILRSSSFSLSRGIALTEYPHFVVRHGASDLEKTNGWIAGLLPASVLSQDPLQWNAPSEWHLRHITSRNGLVEAMSGAKAAEIVGVSAQNFRKYLASEGSISRQKMSFAMWHLLLHRLGVQRMSQGPKVFSSSYSIEQHSTESAQ